LIPDCIEQITFSQYLERQCFKALAEHMLAEHRNLIAAMGKSASKIAARAEQKQMELAAAQLKGMLANQERADDRARLMETVGGRHGEATWLLGRGRVDRPRYDA
jgi:hypothetical protein